MKSRALIPLLVASLLALAAIVAACGDDEEEAGLSLEQYFQRVDKIQDDFDAQIDTVERRYPGALQDPAATGSALTAVAALITDALDELNAIDPPAEAEAAHAETVAAITAVNDFIEDAAATLAGSPTQAQLQEVVDSFGGSEFAEKDQAYDDACAALQQVADDNNVVVDLNCGED